ncbi:uncharacterized protein LOC106150558 [Lingula anatina]|uniref:Uncharacterized protein LOC106150558 n=1 Tax=Lingula anatina TaxID=7574 RepID=A0A1S3H170_LINAN|nr:uncharacterized protein LOC106150558 [Lingula anatina]|eukprot:XP_013378889.1 uncharacterized protein LOC106150558 [Lingula anatina]
MGQAPRGHMLPYGHHVEEPKAIVELDHFPDPETFYREYVHKSVPLVVRGGLKHWPAVQKWKSEDYLREKFGGNVFQVMYKNATADKEHYSFMSMTMDMFLDDYKNYKLYLDSQISIEMAEDITLPGYFGCDHFLKLMTGVNIFFNSGWSSTENHLDITETFFAQVVGGRQWILTPPQDGQYLYTDNFTWHSGISPVDKEAVDLYRYPDVAKVDIYNVTAYEGDIVYCPEGWFHQVSAVGGPNIAIAWYLYDYDCQTKCKMTTYQTYVECCTDIRNSRPDEISCDIKPEEMSLATLLRAYVDDVPFAADLDAGTLEIFSQPEPFQLNSGYDMPILGLGLGGMAEEKIETAVKSALKFGYRLFDTDPVDESEKILGSFLANNKNFKREDVFIIVKVHPKDLGKAATRKSVERSLERLRTDYLDLVLIKAPSCESKEHSCETTGTWQESWESLEDLKTMGSVRSLGVSNFKISQLKELLSTAKAPVSVVQCRFNILLRREKMRNFCRKHGIRFMAHSLLGYDMVPSLGVNPLMEGNNAVTIAARLLHTSPATLMVRWALEQNVTVVPKTSHPFHLLLNVQAQEGLDLDGRPEVREMLDRMPHTS